MKQLIYDILINKLNVKEDLLSGNYDNEPLTGTFFKFDSISLAYLFLELEKKLNKKIDTNLILNYEFNTIKGIEDVILKSSFKRS